MADQKEHIPTSEKFPSSGVSVDPTYLTTQQLWREIAALKELVFTRLAAMDTAIVVAHDDLVRVPTDVQKQVGNLKDLHEEKFAGVKAEFATRDALVNEKFASIQTQFKERDTRAEQTSKDSKVAVDAALQAAKEAVAEQNKSSALAIAKSEAATAKQIDQLVVLIATTSKSSDDKINDAKERLTRIEGHGEGSHSTVSYIAIAISVLVGLISIATFIFSVK